MVNLSHQVFRRQCPCSSCGIRTMCVSKDGGTNFYCNRCGVAYGAFRGHMYDDPKQSEIPRANVDMTSGQPIVNKPVKVVSSDEAMKEMEKLIAEGMNPKKARGKVFNTKTLIKEENEKPKRNEQVNPETTS